MFYDDDDDPRNDERADLAKERQLQRRLAAQLFAHPDPRDPDYPEWDEDEHD